MTKRMYLILNKVFNVSVLAMSVRWSSQDILILWAVAGELSGNVVLRPLSKRAAAMADFIAKNTEEPKKTGGSPTP